MRDEGLGIGDWRILVRFRFRFTSSLPPSDPSAAFSQASFQKNRQPRWQPPWAEPSHRSPSRNTVFFMLRMPTPSTQVFSARRNTRKLLPQQRDHLRHERQPVELRVGVEGGQNLVQTADGDGVAPPEARGTISWLPSLDIAFSGGSLRSGA